ncbi:ABC transporter permease [Dietzia sp.]|uniref:ABC transporter permease n=1 Tax=Dietzia sp. TaxID=1871616 RepID=UPI002FD91B9F
MTTQMTTAQQPRMDDGYGPDRKEDEGDQRAWMTVAAREISVKLRDKNFIFSTIFIVLIMAVSVGISAYFSSRTTTETIAVADAQSQQLVDGIAELSEKQADGADSDGDNSATGAAPSNPTADVMGNTRFETMQVADEAALEQAVSDGDAAAGLIRTDSGWEIVGDREIESSVKATLSAAIVQAGMAQNATAAGTSMEQLQEGTAPTERLLAPGAENEVPPEALRYIAGLAFGFLFYFAAMIFGAAIAGSVVEEKQSRIVEILAAAVPVRSILFGKIAGMTLLATAQVALFAIIGLVAVSFTDYSTILPAIGPAAAWYVLFFIFGFTALASLFGAAGSLASRTEDTQSTMSPILTIVMVAFFASLFLKGTAQVVCSYIPIMSSILMPVRLATGDAQWWEAIIALVITVITTAALVALSDLIYRRSMMQTNRKMTYREAIFGKQ